jgi:hypothetical protein
VLVAHACNPSYSEGRNQEGLGSKPTGQIVCETLSQKYPSQKRAGGLAQDEGPEFNPQYCKKNFFFFHSSKTESQNKTKS